MERWSHRLARLGEVHRFDYPYMLAGRRSPDRQDRLIAAHREALASARRPRRPMVLAGKSMGSRIGCHVALEEPVAGLVCLGYPLRGMGKNGAIRDAVLKQLETPILFVQGTRDNLCPLDLLEQVREQLRAPHELFVVEAGNHSLEVTKTHLKAKNQTQDDIDDQILGAIADFLQRHL